MKKNLIIISLVYFIVLNSYCQNTPPGTYTGSTVNYTRTWVATAPETNPANLLVRALTDVKQTTAYFDGFGRPIQTVAKQASPLGNDIVSANCYDAATGNEIYQYLPFTSNAVITADVSNDGNFKPDRFQQQAAFYSSYLTGQAGDPGWAYSKINYEASPLNRALNSFAPGTNWVGSEGNANHNVQQQFLVNNANDNVQMWNIAAWNISNPEQNIIPASAGTYSAGTLCKTIATDEQGHQTIEYKDIYGQEVLKKVQLSATADNGSGSGYTGWLCTFYVYDDHGNLRFVITPNLVSQMVTAGSWAISQGQADELCYRFEYDQLNEMIIKKTPGTPTGSLGETWMVYDQRHRLVMEQDGNMRSAAVKKWQYIQYDNLDRPVSKGFITDNTNYNNLSYHISSAAGSSNNTSGFSAWPVIANYTSELLAQTSYDNYANVPSTLSQTMDGTANGTGSIAFSTSYSAAPYAQPLSQSAMTQGLSTVVKIEVLGTNGVQYLSSVSFYDDKARVIQTQMINITGGKDIATSQYSWSGQVLGTLMFHNYTSSSNPQSHSLITALTYDATGRLQKIIKTVNSTINGVTLTSPSTNPATIVTCKYDELGRLLNKGLGNLETLTYGYNVRGWLQGINQNYISGLSTSNYFGLELGYDKATSVAPNNSYLYPSFNGNISGTVWKSAGDGINRKYDLSYDNANRLQAAGFMQNSSGTTWDNNYIDFSMNIPGYDANGNIVGMNQNGFAQGGKLSIDQLGYNYINGAGNSNRLSYVSDGQNVSNSTLGDFHFTGAAKNASSVDYTYDANANTISDNNRSISSISYYSYPNLPQTITIINGSNTNTINYIYDATGNKLRKQVTENGVTIASIAVNNVQMTNVLTNITTTTNYINGFEYKTVFYSASSLAPLNSSNTDVLQFVGEEEGRLRFKPALGSTVASFVHDYMIRDHLNNVRVGLTDEVSPPDIYPAATGETNSVTVNGVTNTAQNYESLFYSFIPSDFVPVANIGSWYTNMLTNYGQIVNQNAGGVPVNNDPFIGVPTNASQQVFQLSGNTAVNSTGHNFGLGITLKVMAGDQVNILGTSFWHNSGNLPAGTYPVSAVIASLLTAFGSSSAVSSSVGHSVLDGGSFNTSSTGPTGSLLSPMLNNSPNQSGTQAPYAGINYIIFDDQFRPQGTVVGMDLVSTTTDAEKPHNVNVSITKNGYIYVYVSNQSAINVFFDNLQVVQAHGPLMEEAHYYPSGLLMAGISDRAWNKTVNSFHYQGKEIQNQEWNDGSGLEEYDFSARFYDPQIARWNTQDPAGQYASPYTGMGNNWMNGVDPTGRNFWNTVGTIGIIAGSAVAAYFTAGASLDVEAPYLFAGAVAVGGYAGASIESGNWNPGKWDNNAWKGAITGELVAGSAFVGGEAAFGGPGALTSIFGSGGASVAAAAAEGVGENLAETIGGNILPDILGGRQQIFQLNQLFAASVSGALEGAWNGLNPSPNLESSPSEYKNGYAGLGLKADGFWGNTVFNTVKTVGASLGTNWINGNAIFSAVKVPVGPLQITLGKGQSLYNWKSTSNLLGEAINSVGLLNTAFGGGVDFSNIYQPNYYGGGIISSFFSNQTYTTTSWTGKIWWQLLNSVGLFKEDTYSFPH